MIERSWASHTTANDGEKCRFVEDLRFMVGKMSAAAKSESHTIRKRSFTYNTGKRRDLKIKSNKLSVDILNSGESLFFHTFIHWKIA